VASFEGLREVCVEQLVYITLHNNHYEIFECCWGTFYTGLRQIPYLAGKQGERKMAHTELGLRERRTIEDMLNAKMSVDEMARLRKARLHCQR
jgi:hypothetical protein